MNAFKSVMPVFRSNEWQVRIRLASGAEAFKGEGARYTMHQSQMYADSIRRDLERGLDIGAV